MKRKIAVICAMIMLLTSVAQSASAVNVIMNSSFLNFKDQEPVIIHDTTLVPIRDIAEALGLEVTWDDPTDTVTLKKDNFFVELVIGSTKVKTSSGEKTVLVAPQIINSRTMVPLRFIAEELGLTVLWNEEYQRVVINGQVDTQKAPVVYENPTEVEEVSTDVVVDNEEASFVPEEEETEIGEELVYATINTASSSITFEIPSVFYFDDTDSEESFAYKTLDATDSQHTYNWDIVTTYESYANDAATSGIVIIVQELEPYEGEEYDISTMNQEYPEAPERPERPQFPDIDMSTFIAEYSLAITTQLFIDMEVEVPENIAELSDEEVMEILGFETSEEMEEQVNISAENADFTGVYGYEEYQLYQEEYQIYGEEMEVYWEDYNIYQSEVNAIKAVKNYAVRKFSSVYSNASDDEWVKLFDSYLNTDEEVVYDGVEILDIDGKKIIHATLLAQDPDDEQGVYEYYYYIDGDSVVTIYGGTLYGSEASLEAAEALSGMVIK